MMSDMNITDNRNEKMMMTITALAGILGTAALSTGVISSDNADSLAQLAAIAVPGVVSWVLSVLAYRKSLSGASAKNYVDTVAAEQENRFLRIEKKSAVPEINPESGVVSALAI